MIAGHSPQLIYSHKHHLNELNLPKYVLFTQVDGLIVLKFEILAQNFISPWPASTTTQLTMVQSVFSLQASSNHLFAALTYSGNFPPLASPLVQPVLFPHFPIPGPTPQLQVEHFSFSHPSIHTIGAMATTDEHRYADVMSTMSVDIVLHGVAESLVDLDLDAYFPLNYDADVASQGSVDNQVKSLKTDSLATLHSASALYKPNSLSITSTALAPQYFFVTTVLPSHVVNDRSLFMMYTPSNRVYQTALGTKITIEGTRNIEVCILAGGQSIIFTIHDCWYVPSSLTIFFPVYP